MQFLSYNLAFRGFFPHYCNYARLQSSQSQLDQYKVKNYILKSSKAEKDAFTRTNSDPAWQRKDRTSEGQVQEKPWQLNAASFYTRTKGLPFKSFFLSSKLCYFFFFFAFSQSHTMLNCRDGPNKASPRQLRRPQQVSHVFWQTATIFSHNCSSVVDSPQQSFHVFTRKLRTEVVCHQVGTNRMLFK